MTQKSLARRQRDALAKDKAPDDDPLHVLDELYKNNTSWDELKELYMVNAKQLAGTYDALIQLYKTPGLIKYLENSEHKQTMILFNGIRRDFDQLSKDLINIYSTHKDYSGGVKNDEELARSIGVFENYNNYVVRYDALIRPIYDELVMKAGVAIEKINTIVQAQKQAQEDQDIAVVKDVEYRDVPLVNPETGEADKPAATEG